MRQRTFQWIAFLLLAVGLTNCSTDFEVFTEAKEAFVVYGVLHPDRDTQYVKITRVFQTDGDAIAYVAENDVTVQGLDVRLVQDSTILQAFTLTDIPRDTGIFLQGQAVYAFDTKGSARLEPGKRYQLEIRKPDDPSFLITAETSIPGKPVIKSPKGPYTGVGGKFTWPTVDFENDQYVEFNGGGASAWELRVGFRYLKDSVPSESKFKLLGIQLPDDNCGASPPMMCLQLPAMAFPQWLAGLTTYSVGDIEYSEEPRVTSTPDSLPRVCYIEVTSLDVHLTSFLRSNDPGEFGLNLLMDKQEYSNISGEHYGIFGSIHTDLSWIYMGQCTQFLGGLTTAQPPGCEE